MGLFNSKKHEPLPTRDPRPKGAQKGVVCRDTGSPMLEGDKARTPWLFAKSDKSVARTRRSMGS
jgi:hypothetical protein